MPRFGELPEFLAAVESDELEFRHLYYDHPNYTFKIGGVENLIEGEASKDVLIFPSGHAVDKHGLSKHPVVLGVLGNPIATPMFFEWVSNCDHEVIFPEVKSVIREVYARVLDIEIPEYDRESSAHINFNVGFEREGHVHLQTFGNCACLGTDPDGIMVDYRDWDTGYAEYTLHNIDRPAQYISLFAGLGHFATLAAAESA